jgi:ABC-2 type transport system ATP-binding protein
MNYILTKDVVKIYRGNVVALNEVSFSIDKLGIIGLVGPNGAGKTTLIKILTTLTRPTRGKAEVLEYDVVNDYEKIRRRISLVPQDASPELYLTPYEHVYWYLRSRGLSRGDAEKLTKDVLEKLGLWDHRNKVCAKLSGGMRQRVLIASALAVPADIYFLDEPTVGLDPLARRDVWNVLRDVSRGSLIFLTTHYMEEAEALSDLLIMINRGRIIEIGSPRELIRKVPYKYKIALDKKIDLIKSSFKTVDTEKEKIIYVENENDLPDLLDYLLSQKIDFSLKTTTLEDLFIMKVRESENR